MGKLLPPRSTSELHHFRDALGNALAMGGGVLAMLLSLEAADARGVFACDRGDKIVFGTLVRARRIRQNFQSWD
jgi:hypothetical protein